MNIHVFGDSHSRNYGWPNLYPQIGGATANWLGAITAHRIGRDGLNVLDLRKFNVKNGDYAIFTFGEIDVRCHIGRIRDETSADSQHIIDLLVQQYFKTLASNKSLYEDINFIIRFTTPPSDKGNNPQYPFYGDISDRAEITKTLNRTIKESCPKYSFHYLDGFDDFSDETGRILEHYRDENVHLNSKATPLLEKSLFTLIQEIHSQKTPPSTKIYFKKTINFPQSNEIPALIKTNHAGLTHQASPEKQTYPANQPEILNREGERFFKLKRFKEAHEAFSQAITLDPGHAVAYNNLGVLFWEIGDSQKALTYFQKAVSQDPKLTNAIENINDLLHCQDIAQ